MLLENKVNVINIKIYAKNRIDKGTQQHKASIKIQGYYMKSPL